MFTKFFIHRPIFAAVISIVITIAGAVAGVVLPVAQYPDIVPPTVTVEANYPGASPADIAKYVATPIEKEVNGVEDMIYMSSNSSSDGKMTLTVSFEVGTDLDMATVLVQNRVNIAVPKLPEEVRRQGIKVKKKSTNMVLIINLISPKGEYGPLELSNYATVRLKDELARIPGVGEATVMDSREFSMRVWLDPRLMSERDLTPKDVVNAIQGQNSQIAAGKIGQEPAPLGQELELLINTRGRLSDVEEFENIVLRSDEEGRLIYLKDVARIELGSFSYSMETQLDGKPASTIGIYQLPGANALQVAEGVRAKMKELDERLRLSSRGLEYKIVYDTTKFVEASIAEVYETLWIAIALVFLTVYVFLQDIRSTLVPAITIPVSLIGTFAMMAALGFSVNTLTLFGLVLVIGIVVDDAIVVVENTMRLIDTEGLPAKKAAEKAMEEVTGPVIATTLVLMAVFIPTAFMPGITGQLYRQFALTIAGATLISSICALTLSPAMCGILLRPTPQRQGPFFRAFNWGFKHTTNTYMATVSRLLRVSLLVIVMWGAIIGVTLFGLMKLPTGFIPDEDQGYLFVGMQLPGASSLQRTQEVLTRVTKACEEKPGVAHVIGLNGYSMLDSTASGNMATAIVVLEPWEDRQTALTSLRAIFAELDQEFSDIPEANGFVYIPPAITGLGQAGGFTLQVLDQEDVGLIALGQVAGDVIQEARNDPTFAGASTSYDASQRQLKIEIDVTKAEKLNVTREDVKGVIEGYLGSYYVNDFNKFGNIFKVVIQAGEDYRDRTEDILELKVRNAKGQMVPLRSIVQIDEVIGPQVVRHFNIYPSAQINGQAAPAFSSGQAMSRLEAISKNAMPDGFGYAWSDMSFQEKRASGGQAAFIFALSVVFVYLVLAAQYESWSAPLAIVLSVPLAVAGAIAATAIRSLDVNVYTQIGLILLIGLAGKNAILIVEFAREARHRGKSIIDAAEEASRLRFRPLLMTAFAFILGVVPLVIASGAGAASRQALGTVVFGGMLAATFLGVFFVPSLFLIIQTLSEWLMGKRGKTPTASVQEPTPRVSPAVEKRTPQTSGLTPPPPDISASEVDNLFPPIDNDAGVADERKDSSKSDEDDDDGLQVSDLL